MARPLRIEYPGAVYHITSRGNDRKPLFLDDKDRKAFLDILAKCCNLFNWLCHAYCLMGDHYHIVIETVEATLSRGMKHLNGVYTQKFNWNHHKVGHILQGRFKAILIEKESHLLEACRYVVLNPVRAKMTKKPEAWPWSSYLGTCGLCAPANCLSTDWLLQQFSDARRTAQRNYEKFVEDGVGVPSIWDDVKCQILLGNDDFVTMFSDVAKGIEELKEIPRSQRFMEHPSLRQLFSEAVSQGKTVRDRIICEAVELHGYTQKAVADHLQLHYSTVNRILTRQDSKKQQE